MTINVSPSTKATSNEPVNIDVPMDSFKLQAVLDLDEQFGETSCALRALAELISTSDLAAFQDSNGDHRWGLSQLFNICIEKQEERLKSMRTAVINSPEFALEIAKDTVGKIKNGRILSPRTNPDVRQSIESVNTIISVFGEDEYPEATVIQNQLMGNTQSLNLSAID